MAATSNINLNQNDDLYRHFYMELDPLAVLPNLPTMFYRRFSNEMSSTLIFRDKDGVEFKLSIEKTTNGAYIVDGMSQILSFYNIPLGGWLNVWYGGDNHFFIELVDNKNGPIPIPKVSKSTDMQTPMEDNIDLSFTLPIKQREPQLNEEIAMGVENGGGADSANDVQKIDYVVAEESLPTNWDSQPGGQPRNLGGNEVDVINIGGGENNTNVLGGMEDQVFYTIGGKIDHIIGDVEQTQHVHAGPVDVGAIASVAYHYWLDTIRVDVIPNAAQIYTGQKLLTHHQATEAHCLLIPAAFARLAFPSRLDKVHVIAANGKVYHVELHWGNRTSEVFFGKGWRRLASEHELRKGHILLMSVSSGNEKLMLVDVIA